MAEGGQVSLVVVHWAANRRVLNLMSNTSRDTVGLMDDGGMRQANVTFTHASAKQILGPNQQ